MRIRSSRGWEALSRLSGEVARTLSTSVSQRTGENDPDLAPLTLLWREHNPVSVHGWQIIVAVLHSCSFVSSEATSE